MFKVTYRNKEWQLEAGITLRQAISKVGLNPENVLGLRQGKLISDDTTLADGDEVVLVTIVSGG